LKKTCRREKQIDNSDIMQLEDKFGRKIKYLRLSVTDRCNLRCFYCMPAEGITYLPKAHLLTYEEMLRLTDIFSSLGVDKIRITGGEPFARKDLIHFLSKLSENQTGKDKHYNQRDT
jgi:molybdenum cofactor biosynthesis enzyme MoaA